MCERDFEYCSVREDIKNLVPIEEAFMVNRQIPTTD